MSKVYVVYGFNDRLGFWGIFSAHKTEKAAHEAKERLLEAGNISIIKIEIFDI